MSDTCIAVPAVPYLERELAELPAATLGGLHHAEQHVRVHRALVRLVQDHHGVAQQQGVSDGLAQKHAVRHELELGLGGGDVLEAHRVAHLAGGRGDRTTG